MKLTFDPEANAAYVYLDERREFGTVKRSLPVDDGDVNGEVILDFDGEGKLIGIEVLNAAELLPVAALRTAQLPPRGVKAG